MSDKENRVCPASQAWMLDNPIRRLFQKPRRIVAEFVGPGYRVIDIGCGPGYFSLAMAGMVGPAGRVLAVDLQPEMLRRIERKMRRRGLDGIIKTHACQADTLAIPPATEPFDFALLYYMIHETPDPENLLRELYPFLKKGGKMLIVDPVFHVKEEQFGQVIQKAREIGYQVDGPSRQKGGWCAVLSKE
jgi:ubiquinone/menaquinone biosynthesis C-methylase UbiE